MLKHGGSEEELVKQTEDKADGELIQSVTESQVSSVREEDVINCWIIKAVYLYITLHESLEERHYVSVTVHFKTLKTGKNSRQFHSQSWPDPPSLQLHRGPLCPPYVCDS